MDTNQNGRLSKIEELLLKHDERMAALDRNFETLMQNQERSDRALENTERLLILEGDRIDRLERIEVRQSELFAEISEQLRNMNKR